MDWELNYRNEVQMRSLAATIATEEIDSLTLSSRGNGNDDHPRRPTITSGENQPQDTNDRREQRQSVAIPNELLVLNRRFRDIVVT